MRRFGMQKMKLCKANLILRLPIWLIRSYHDKVNKKYSYIFQKWPVTSQFRKYICFCIITFLQNLICAYLPVLFEDDSLSPSLYTVM